VISGGTLVANAWGCIDHSCPVTVNAGGTLRVQTARVFSTNDQYRGTMTIADGGTVFIDNTIGTERISLDRLDMTGGSITGLYSTASTYGGMNAGTVRVHGNATSAVISAIRLYGTAQASGDGAIAFSVDDGAEFNVSAVATDGPAGVATSLIKSGPGVLTLSGTNTYGGGTQINGGTLSVGEIADGGTSHIGSAGGTANYLALRDGTLRYTGTTTIASGALTFSTPNFNTYRGGTITIGSNATMNVVTTGGANRYDFQHKTIAFDTAGGGTLALGSAINFVLDTASSGTTTFRTTGGAQNRIVGPGGVNMGSAGHTVMFDVATGTGSLVVNTGGTLGGTGRVAGLVTVNSGGCVSPGGDAPGTLALEGGLTLSDGATLDIDVGSSSDLLRVTGGTLTGAGTAAVTVRVKALDRGVRDYPLMDWTGAAVSGVDLDDFVLVMVPGRGSDARLVIRDNALILVLRTGTTLIVR